VEALYVWWVGEREPASGMLDHVRAHLARAFDATVLVWDGPDRPQGTYDERRKQHSSGRMLKFLLDRGPGPGTKVIGITDQDLFIPILTFVFGEAQLGGAAAVVSTARLFEPAPRYDQRLFTERLAKECVHELGHALGLLHCAASHCAMSRSASVRDVDVKSGGLCDGCRARLRDASAGGSPLDAVSPQRNR
jgi:archaemetzincin